MKSLITKAALGLAMAATALTVSAPAQAQRYGGYRDRDNTGTAVVAGIAGLAIGAALASNSGRGRTYYVDNGYGYEGYAPAYNGYYNNGYYANGYNGYYANGYNGYYSNGGYYRQYRHHDRDDRGYENRGGYGGHYRR